MQLFEGKSLVLPAPPSAQVQLWEQGGLPAQLTAGSCFFFKRQSYSFRKLSPSTKKGNTGFYNESFFFKPFTFPMLLLFICIS